MAMVSILRFAVHSLSPHESLSGFSFSRGYQPLECQSWLFFSSRHGHRKPNGYGRPLQEDTVISLTLSQLTDAERSRLLTRLNKDSDDAVREEFAWKYVRQAFVDPLVWGYALLHHGFAFTLYTLSLFLVCLYQVALC